MRSLPTLYILRFCCCLSFVLLPTLLHLTLSAQVVKPEANPDSKTAGTTETSAPPGTEPSWTEPKLIPALEKDLMGVYMQVQSGGLLEILPGGRMVGYPATGNYKYLEPGKIEMYGRNKNGSEERTPARVYRTPQGLGLVRNIHGEDDPSTLLRLNPTPLEPDKWQGPAIIHLLLALDKRAVKRNVTLDKEGYFRTAEGGYYFRLYQGPTGSVLGYSTEQGAATVSLKLLKSSTMLVAYDALEKPKFLAIVQLDAKLDKPAELPKAAEGK